MSLNLFAINVGNSRSQFAHFIDGQPGELYAVPHDDAKGRREQLAAAYAPLRDMGDVPVLIASVHEAAAAQMTKDARELFGCEPIRIEKEINVPIGRKLDPETLVGADRLLDAAAAYDKLKQACIVIDAGTAVTVDFVDGQGTFHGGAILPGAQMMLNAMHEHTAALPEIEFAPPNETFGHSTAQAMLTGVFHGIRGAVRELIEKYAEQYGAYPHIIATGGNAKALFENYELIETIVPELTLQGMMITLRYRAENAGE